MLSASACAVPFPQPLNPKRYGRGGVYGLPLNPTPHQTLPLPYQTPTLHYQTRTLHQTLNLLANFSALESSAVTARCAGSRRRRCWTCSLSSAPPLAALSPSSPLPLSPPYCPPALPPTFSPLFSFFVAPPKLLVHPSNTHKTPTKHACFPSQAAPPQATRVLFCHAHAASVASLKPRRSANTRWGWSRSGRWRTSWTWSASRASSFPPTRSELPRNQSRKGRCLEQNVPAMRVVEFDSALCQPCDRWR